MKTYTLKDFEDYIESLPDRTEFRFALSEPFSWRGSYDEVCFSILEGPSTKEEVLKNILRAYKGTFMGWKGGEYTYSGNTNVNFEEDPGSWSDGGYVESKIHFIVRDKTLIEAENISGEKALVKVAFPSRQPSLKITKQVLLKHFELDALIKERVNIYHTEVSKIIWLSSSYENIVRDNLIIIKFFRGDISMRLEIPVDVFIEADTKEKVREIVKSGRYEV